MTIDELSPLRHEMAERWMAKKEADGFMPSFCRPFFCHPALVAR
jgi:hypothetical protein